jgi:O-antigen ligase
VRLVQKSFLVRRRWDRYLTWIGGAGLPLRHGLTTFAAIVFALIGIYLVAVRHRSTRLASHAFLSFAVAYLVFSITLAVVRGEFFVGNRQITYSLLIGAFAFISHGMVLVRDPLRYFVLGARAGTIAVAAIALWLGVDELPRFGMDGNPAPFAMVAAIGMIAAIVPLRDAPRWAPNSIIYVAFGSVSIFASQTRAVLVVVPIILIVEWIVWLRRRSVRSQATGVLAGTAALLLVVSFGPVHTMISERFVPVFEYFAGDTAAWGESQTADLRLSMWQGAARAVAEKPLTGHGEGRMERVVELAPVLQPQLQVFEHVHNIVLDEMLHHGLIGLMLLGGVVVSGTGHVLRHADDQALQRNVVYVLLVLAAYGMLHNPMLHETTIAAFFFYLGTTIAHVSRRRMAARRAL